jgi:hypothetical protein
MKAPQKKQNASVLMVTMVLCAVIGIALALMLLWARQHNELMKRSLAWNKGIPVAEAGIEEALAHLKVAAPPIQVVAQNGWSSKNGLAVKGRNLGNDATNYVTIDFSVVNAPIITSYAYVKAPLRTAEYISRTVRVTATRAPKYPVALGVKNGVVLNGNTIVIDSFDSRSTNYSDAAGHYVGNTILSKRKDGGDVFSNNGDFNDGNAKIYGRVSLGTSGVLKVGPNGAIGSLPFVDNSANWGKVQDGWFDRGAQVDFPPVEIPSGPFFGLANTGITTNGTTYGYWIVGSTDPKQPRKFPVAKLDNGAYVTGYAALVVNDSLSVSGSKKITLAPGAKLDIYCKASSASISGDGIDNPGTAANFRYFGLPGNNSLTMSGGAHIIAVIYAPDTDVTLGGGGNEINFQGAAMAKTFRINGGMNLHYDEALRANDDVGFLVTSWSEI